MIHVNTLKIITVIYSDKEQSYGALFLIFGIIFLVGYVVAFFAPYLSLPEWLHTTIVEYTVLILAIVLFFTIIRLGWNMLTAAPAISLKEQEARLNDQNSEESH